MKEDKAASELLNGKHRSAVTKSKTRKGQASRAHRLQKVVGRGLGAAVKAYAIAKKGIKTGGFKNMVSDALVTTTRTLLGAACAGVTGRGYQAGMSVEYKKGKDGVKCNVAIDFSKTPKGGDGQPINSKLRLVRLQCDKWLRCHVNIAHSKVIHKSMPIFLSI